MENDDKIHAVSKSELIEQLEAERHRGDALATTLLVLRDVVTHDAETKAEFVSRVKQILGSDPDERLKAFEIEAKRDGLLLAHTLAVMQIGVVTDSPCSDIAAGIEELIRSL